MHRFCNSSFWWYSAEGEEEIYSQKASLCFATSCRRHDIKLPAKCYWIRSDVVQIWCFIPNHTICRFILWCGLWHLRYSVLVLILWRTGMPHASTGCKLTVPICGAPCTFLNWAIGFFLHHLMQNLENSYDLCRGKVCYNHRNSDWFLREWQENDTFLAIVHTSMMAGMTHLKRSLASSYNVVDHMAKCLTQSCVCTCMHARWRFIKHQNRFSLW